MAKWYVPLVMIGLTLVARPDGLSWTHRLASLPVASLETWWREAKGWTLMYRGGLLVGGCVAVVFVLWRVAAARRERERLEALVASRTRQLRQGEELFRSIFEHATEGIFQSSLDGHNLRANPAMARLCGYPDPAQMSRELTDAVRQFYVRPERRQEINDAVAREGAAVDFESEVRRRDGSTFWISESVRLVVNPASGETVYQGSIVDVTARREMQAAQEHARRAAEAANAAKTAFLTHVTHELRTPLTGILSNARVALRDHGLDEGNRARFLLITRSGEHLLALIDEVLDLSCIEAGHTELNPRPFSLEELLRTVADGFDARATEKRLEFRCTVDPFVPGTVRGDPLRLRQVLDNLLGNAFKFTAQGTVGLDVRRAAAGRVRFEVADTGTGIPADQCAAIFEPFRQVASPRPPDHSGVGLGLHISARLVRLMDGELCVASAVGEGSRFFFDLPLLDEKSGESLPASVIRQKPVRGGPTASNVSRAFDLPPAAEILSLHTLSLEGDIVRLRARLKELAGADPALADFVREVEALAVGFRMDAISEYLARISAKGAQKDDRPLAVDPWTKHMRRGEFSAAWAISDAVLKSRRGKSCTHLPRHEQFLWNGDPITGKRVLIRCYHGLGDTVQFVRYASLVRAQAAEVTLWTQPSLVALLRGVEGVDRVLPLHEGAPDGSYEVELEIMELPHLFRSTVTDLPSRVPYLQVSPGAPARRPVGECAGCRVGVVWQAGEWDAARSVPVTLIAGLAKIPGVELCAFQRGPALAEWRDEYGPITGTDDVVATAHAMQTMDLILSVDSFPAHLAGALGRPVWTLLHAAPDWRWLEARIDSPWYPTMRLFRQSRPGDWDNVLAEVAAQLRAFAHSLAIASAGA